MKKSRHKSKTGKVKTPKPSRGNSRSFSITRAEARRQAERHVLRWMFKGATVRDGAEARSQIYNVRREDTWVVYKNPRDMTLLRSSEVVVVCKRTGRVLYEGSACDEG